MSTIDMPDTQINLIQLKTAIGTNIKAMQTDARYKLSKLEK